MTDTSTPREDLIAAIRSGEADAVDVLLETHPELASATDERGVSLLLLALYFRRGDVAERIAARREALTLHEAVALGRLGAVVEALDSGEGGIEDRSNDGFTPLQYAAFFGREEVVAELLTRGADVNAASENEMKVQPLHSAAAFRSVAICRRLLEAGADPDARQQMGYTPLMSAALHGQDELAELLLARGADPALRAEDGKTARDLALQGEHTELAERLARHGA
ncbi:MAG TPA: ankyrin repeat domain-containing protein [Thermoanaerobaculia bacterium]|nr:ankyrin repeat domain-containing protein [Thermoanaerobaculia bacterium]